MTNEMVFSVEKEQKFFAQMKQACVRPLQLLADYYGHVLGRPVGVGQTLLLVNAQAAFIMAVFPSMSFALRIVCLAWLAGAVVRCRAAF